MSMKKQKDIVATDGSYRPDPVLGLILIQLGNKNLNISPNNIYFLLSDLSLETKVKVPQCMHDCHSSVFYNRYIGRS